MLSIPMLVWKDYIGCEPKRVISFRKAKKMMEKECLAYLVHIQDISIKTPSLESVLVVSEFTKIFLIDLLGI